MSLLHELSELAGAAGEAGAGDGRAASAAPAAAVDIARNRHAHDIAVQELILRGAHVHAVLDDVAAGRCQDAGGLHLLAQNQDDDQSGDQRYADDDADFDHGREPETACRTCCRRSPWC